MLAKGKLICGEIDEALKNVAKVLAMDPKNEECNILSAMIEMKNNNLGASYHYIEAAMSEDFTIRENPLFMLFKGQIELKLGDNEKAIASLEQAYNTLGLNNPNSDPESYKTNPRLLKLKILTFGEGERCKVITSYAKALGLNKKMDKA